MAIKLDASSFVNPGDEMNFICPVCHDVSLAPRVLPCQHWLCLQCITVLTDKRCHTCRAHYTQGVVHRTLRAWLDSTAVKCDSGDCKWEGQYGQLAEHRRSCKSALLTAENTKLKGENVILRKRSEDQQRKVEAQAKELTEVRVRKETLERERHQYAENLLEKLLTKDRSRSPQAKDKKEKNDKKEKKPPSSAEHPVLPELVAALFSE